VFFGIECKAGKNKTTALQDKNIKEINKAGGYALVVNEDNMRSFWQEIEAEMAKRREA